MWLIDRLWGKRELAQAALSGQPIVNDPSVPLVSILIRSMDRPTLQRALESAAKQTWPNLEIVVVAACGRAHRPLPDSIHGRPLRLVLPDPDRRLPRPEAANMCLEAARGEWLNFLDDDDELLPAHLSTLLNAPRPGNERVLFAATRVDDAQGKPIGRISHAGNHVQLYFHSRSMLGATAYHRQLIDDGARFDADFPVHEDHDFQVACATRTQFLFVDIVTCIWNAQTGDSGCGFGANDDTAQRREAVIRIRSKWETVFKRWLRNADALLFAGKQYLDGGDIPAALECLERALTLRTNDVNALNLCGMANFRAGDLDRAETLLTRAIKRLPKHQALRDNLALIRSKRAN
jgi:glycosyltransferase involved in cell wall biosynthesis